MSVIMKSEELNICEIARRSGISYSSVVLHLDYFVKAGLLTEKRFNKIRIFKFNRTNPYTEALVRFFADWQSLDPHASEIAFN